MYHGANSRFILHQSAIRDEYQMIVSNYVATLVIEGYCQSVFGGTYSLDLSSAKLRYVADSKVTSTDSRIKLIMGQLPLAMV